MGIHRALIGAAILALVFASAAIADEPLPPMPTEPPAGVALPGAGTPPPPPRSETVILVPPRPAYEQPIFPTDQPQNRDVDPYAPSVQDFDRTTNAVRMRTGPCAPRMAPCPMPCPSPCAPSFDPCPDPCDPCKKPCFKGYGGISLQAYPGLGFGVEFGMWFARLSCVDLAWEVGLSYQDLTDSFNGIETGQAGKWMGARAGVKASFLPQGNSHPTLRAGLGWNIATGDVSNNYDIGDITETDFAINYFGGYLGVGWEFDLFNGAITTGPEIFGFAGFGDRDNAEAYTATIAWHFLVNF